MASAMSWILVVVLAFFGAQPVRAEDAVRLHAAGSLADLFLTYCTNANAAARQVSGAQVIALPPALAVGADYGLTVLTGADHEKASKLAMFILSAQGQAILERYGFAAPTKPTR